ncbi:hypothetical protein H6CHR_03241 [Variovorax sp. PBL-H6]|uniref:hypothetical protein n=1 Tax=Variovorax sp. PBL-H6 TaxID=434009 RepID=UPI001317B816|nr:hypothetical protein [Variovorax sp. PBL-H6]VTU29671.1 hypothetical protein H6CHR_03241 [Variovorax sp. PBL-H6]
MAKLSASDKAFRRACAVAVLNGLWTSYGNTIMDADDADYAMTIRSISRMAYQQADEMLRRERAEQEKEAPSA